MVSKYYFCEGSNMSYKTTAAGKLRIFVFGSSLNEYL
jgi:hypothetical protein